MTAITPTERATIPPPRTPRPILVAVLLIAICGIVQLWTITAGFKSVPVYTDYYSRLTDAFQHGQLNLRRGPPPELLALPDPYDANANARYALHDASLYNGKYYLYFGPTPALLAAALCWIIRDFNPDFGDQYLVFIFLFGTTILAAILIFQARNRFFPEQSPWSAAIPILSFGLGTPMIFTLARAAVYEASVAAGQFFLLAGILAAWSGIRSRKSSVLALAGICWALSAGSRIALMPAEGAVALLTAWQLRGWNRRSTANIAALFAPLLVGLLLHAWYNYARFGSVTEIGLRYQLAALNQHTMKPSDFAGMRFIAPNLFSYVFQPPCPIKLYPYLIARGPLPIMKWFGLPKSYNAVYVIGIAWSQPILLFSAAALPFLRRRSTGEQQSGIWLTLSLFTAAIVGILPALTIAAATMRYLLDAVPSLAVLSALGVWTISRSLAARPRLLREFRTAALLICIATAVMGILLGTYGYESHFRQFNQPLYDWLRSFLPALPW